MKTLFLTFVALLILASVALWVFGKDAREIRTEIDIAAPIEEVWAIVADVEAWSEWSPIINKSHGNVALGTKLDITMMSEETGKDGPQYSPVIIKLNEPNLLHWRAEVVTGIVFTNDKVLQLEETATGTRLIHKELFSGMMVPMFWSGVEKEVPLMLKSMNEALKAKAEKGSN